jgi:hypothetical protein
MLVKSWGKECRNIRKQESGETTYTVADVAGEKLFQIQTYGSPERKAKGTVNQTIQFTKEQGVELVEILKRELNI